VVEKEIARVLQLPLAEGKGGPADDKGGRH
jgi:hypothetical protein